MTQLNYSDSQLSYTLTKEAGCKIKMQVKLSKELTEESYKTGFRNVKKNFSVPGFRKGRLPDSVIHEHCSKQIADAYKDAISQTVFSHVLPICKIYPHNSSEIQMNVTSMSKEKGADYTVEYETIAEIPEFDPSNLVVKEIQHIPFDPDQLENYYKKLTLQEGTWTQIQDRAIQEDDFVTMKYSLNEKEDEWEEEITVYINEMTQNMKWAIPKLIGKNIGEIFNLSPPPLEPLNEQTSVYKVCITAIQTCEPATDEKMSEHFKGESKEKIYEALKLELLQENDKKEFDQKNKTITQAILDSFSFDLPISLIEKAAKDQLEYIKKSRQEHHLPPLTAQEHQDLYTNTKNRLYKQWQIDLLIEKFIDQESIEPDENQIRAAVLQDLAKNSSFNLYLQDPDQFCKKIKNQLTQKIALETLYERARKEPAI